MPWSRNCGLSRSLWGSKTAPTGRPGTAENTLLARPHQDIAQRVPGYECEAPRVTAVNLDVQRIRRKSMLNGLINEYSRAA